MPLDPDGLASALADIAADPPETSAGCAQAWADAMEDYAAGIVPLSSDVSSAAATLAGALATAFASPAAAPGMGTAFAAFATTLSLSMAGFVGSPPPGPVGFATQFLVTPPPATHAAAGSALAGIIHTWMTTGTATATAPGSVPQNWA